MSFFSKKNPSPPKNAEFQIFAVFLRSVDYVWVPRPQLSTPQAPKTTQQSPLSLRVLISFVDKHHENGRKMALTGSRLSNVECRMPRKARIVIAHSPPLP